MRNIKKIIVMAAAFLMAFGCIESFAAESKITSVSVKVSEVKEEAGTIWTAEPTTSSSYYEIEEYSWSKDYDDWDPGVKVTLTVYLVTTGDRNFASKSDLSYSVSNGEKVSISRESSDRVKIKLYYYPKVTLEAPENIDYEDDYEITWDKVTYAGGYEVKLYRDGSSFKTISLDGRSNNSCDFSSYATDDDYEYTFKVRAVASSGKSSYIKASEWTDGEDGVYSSDENTSYGSFSGNGSKTRFKDEDGDYVTGWQLLNGYWYYFDPDTKYALTGWTSINGLWYYFDSDGRMLTGWQQSGDFWYYLNPDVDSPYYGSMVMGWVQTAPTGPWYYLNTGAMGSYPTGAMLHDTVTPDGYYVDSNGEWR